MKVMKVGMIAGTLFVAGIFLTNVCVADDTQDIKTALKQHYAAFNAGDADCWGATLLLKYKRRTSKLSLMGA